MRSRWSGRSLVELLEFAAVGQRPVERRDGPRPPRAARAMVRTVRVGDDRVTWRTRLGRPGEMPLADVAQVVLVEAEYLSTMASDVVVPYALVIDPAGAVRLRVAPGASLGNAAATAQRRRVRSVWEEAGLPVTSATTALDRAKDHRRRWPEAFTVAHAYPLSLTAAALAGWMLLVVPVLDHLLGG